MHFLFKNLVFYSILWGSPSAALGAQKAAQIADTSAVLLGLGGDCVRPRIHKGWINESSPEASKTETSIRILGCLIFETLTPIGPVRFELRGGVGEG